MASTDKELEEQLLEAGNKLLNPPSSVEELLPLLDQVENCLSKVEQSPTESMQRALDPSLKALVADQLFRHTDVDVKVALASCISEITRITAPDAPYNDDQMKDVFQLIVSSFENLEDKSSRSFGKRTMILDTVAKVRSCVVMLDLECDALIIEMFRLFLYSIRDYHPESVFSSMETIMTLVLEESEDVSVELLSSLLASVKRDNEEVLPIARKLGEKVLENCAPKVKPYVVHAVKSLGLSVGDYSSVVAFICQEVSGTTVEQNDNHAADEDKQIGASADETAKADKEMIVEEASDKQVEPANDDTPKPVVSNGISQSGEYDKFGDPNSLKEHEDENHADEQKQIDLSTNSEQQNLDAEMVDTESNPELAAKKKGKKVTISKKPNELAESSETDVEKGEKLPDDKINAKDVSDSPCEDPSAEAAVTSKNKKDTDAVESESGIVLSPSVSENLPDESLSKKRGRSKKKESLIKDSAPSGDDIPKRAFEEANDSEEKQSKRHGKKVSGVISGGDKSPAPKDSTKKERGTLSKPEEKPLKQFSKKSEVGSTNGDQSSLKHMEDKKRSSRGKAVSESDGIKSSSKDDSKENISSLKSGSKLTKDVQEAKETPKSVPNRKHTLDASKDYGEEVIGEKVKVWWPQDRQFYEGKIQSFDPDKKKHKVVYNDGDVEILNLKRQRFEFIGSGSASDEEEADSPSHVSASDMPLKKKVKTNPDRSKKQVKVDASPKQSIGASSSKAKTASAKPGQKSKESSKTDGKSLDDSKASRKMEDDTGAGSKDHTPKTGSKSADASKSASKSKNEDRLSKTGKSKEDSTSPPKALKSKQETPKSSKVKQDTSKASPISKGKPIKSGGKSNANGGKLKSGPSKDKVEEEEDEDNSADSGEAQENTKRKATSSSKRQGSEVKSGKKRSRGA